MGVGFFRQHRRQAEAAAEAARAAEPPPAKASGAARAKRPSRVESHAEEPAAVDLPAPDPPKR